MALKAKGKRALQAAADDCVPIIGHASLAARFVQATPYGGWGMLPRVEADILERSIKRCGQVFVVWSYDTPIGWRDDMGWRVPDVKYSCTTTNHQNVLAVAFANRGFYSGARW
jgi:hypothetical protein